MKDWQGIAERRADEIAGHKAEIERLRAALRWATKWMTPRIVSRDPEFEQHRPTLDAALAASPE